MNTDKYNTPETSELTPFYPYYTMGNIFIDLLYDKKSNVYVRLIDYRIAERSERLFREINDIPAEHTYGRSLYKIIGKALKQAANLSEMERGGSLEDFDQKVLSIIKAAGYISLSALINKLKLPAYKTKQSTDKLAGLRLITYVNHGVKYNRERLPFTFHTADQVNAMKE